MFAAPLDGVVDVLKLLLLGQLPALLSQTRMLHGLPTVGCWSYVLGAAQLTKAVGDIGLNRLSGAACLKQVILALMDVGLMGALASTLVVEGVEVVGVEVLGIHWRNTSRAGELTVAHAAVLRVGRGRKAPVVRAKDREAVA